MKIYDMNRHHAEVGRANADWQTDSKSKEFQNQIANAQNRLKDLTVDKELGEDEKSKKRQEIQQQITDLNNQLRQHQLQMQREMREQKADTKDSEEEQANGIRDEIEQPSVHAQTAREVILSANSAIKLAQAQGSLSMEMENRVRVLQTEIKQDARYGKDTEQKKNELEKLEKKAVKVKGAKMSYLANVSKEIKRGAELQKETDRSFKKKKQTESVNPAAASWNSSVKRKTDIYIQGNMFSHVDFHF